MMENDIEPTLDDALNTFVQENDRPTAGNLQEWVGALPPVPEGPHRLRCCLGGTARLAGGRGDWGRDREALGRPCHEPCPQRGLQP